MSVCIIAKNEEKHIENCLKSLLPFGFEIVVTDTGSTDNTKEIAAKYADKVLDFEWIGDFSAARNFCASKASNNWILSLDCDEYVNTIDVQSMRILMQKLPKYTGIIRLKNLVYDSTGKPSYTTDDVTRFYNRNFYSFFFPIHEQIADKRLPLDNQDQKCFLLPMEVIHHGYAISPEEMKKKQERNLEMLYKSLETADNRDSYTYFQIGQSEYILDHVETAIEYYEKGMQCEINPEMLYVQIMITSLAKAYVQTGAADKALQLMEQYAEKCKTAKYVFSHANVLLDNEQPLKALLYYVKATTLADKDTLGENLLDCYRHIIDLYLQMGDEKMANIFIEKYEACMAERERVLHGM